MRYSELMILHEDVSSYVACVNDTPGMFTTALMEDVSVSQINAGSLNDPVFVRKIKNEMKRCKRYDKLLKILQKLNALLVGLTVGKGVASVASTIGSMNNNINAVNQKGLSSSMKMAFNHVNNTAAWQRREDAIIARQNDPIDSFVDFIDGTNDRTYVGGERQSNPKPGFNRELLNDRREERFGEIEDIRDDGESGVRNSIKRTIIILLIQAAIAALLPLVRKAIHDKELKNTTMLKGQIDSSIRLYEKQLKDCTSDDERMKLQGAIDDLNSLKEMMATTVTESDNIIEFFGYDMDDMTSCLEISNSRLDAIDKLDLTNEEDVKKLRSRINTMNNTKTLLKIWSKLAPLATVGVGVSGVGSAMNSDNISDSLSATAISSLLTLVSGKISKCLSKSIEKDREEELIYVSKTLDSTISKLYDKKNSVTGADKDAIDKQIRTAESFKNKVDSQLDYLGVARQDANTKALRRIGNAGYANAAATLTR